MEVKNLTAFWKFSKIPEGFWDYTNNQPTIAWFNRRREGWKNGKVKHHLPRNHKWNKDFNVWHNGKSYNFIEGRKLLWFDKYIELYEKNE
jgi:hypothetical protein